MMSKEIKIKKKNGDDHSVISVRMKDETLIQLDTLSRTTNRSRNSLINYLIKMALSLVVIED